ncbi:MAG TPA: hypothetical protein VFV49_05870, partial [Thermoanaerobaculia bacterium]|nr:hypothetical protein [Thermoanaerobaculia bacterium]
GPTGPSAVPCEWNMFGTHAVDFVQYQDNVTTITGGATGPNGTITTDPLVGGVVTIDGNDGFPAVLVDTNPISFWSSQVYWGQMSFGSGDAVISAPMNYRMHARFVSPFRLFTSDNLQAATGFACCMQTTIPYDQVTWPVRGVSALADALNDAAANAQGIMVRFTAYIQNYFQNGTFNNIPIQPQNYEALAADLKQAWDQWNANQSTELFFSNPCYSSIVGTLGVWDAGELASAPGGRYLVPQNAIPTATSPTSIAAADDRFEVTGDGHEMHFAAVAAGPSAPPPPPSTPLGPVLASVNTDLGIISLDFSSTIPEISTDLTKGNFGPLSLGVLSNGSVTPIATINYDQYSKTAYEATSGIIDLPFTGPIGDGPLVIQAVGQTALLEEILNAQTDSRGIYLDQGGATAFDIGVFQSGMTATGVNVLVARYGPGVQSPANYSSLNLIPAGPSGPTGTFTSNVQVVNFDNGTQFDVIVPNPAGPTSIKSNVTVVTADGNGVAQLGISAQAPGFVVLGFFPYTPPGPTPTPPPYLLPPGPTAPITFPDWVSFADYTTVRVLPFDDEVPQQLVDLWNSTHDPQQAWEFIYNPTPPSASVPGGGGILYVYDMVFSVMLEHVNLGSRTAVESNLASVWSVIAPDSAAEGSGNMPITRDMSAGKRLALQLWIYLAYNGYDVSTLSLTATNGWSPTGPTG